MTRTVPAKLALVLAWMIIAAIGLVAPAVPARAAAPELAVELTSLRTTGTGDEATAVAQGRVTNTGAQPAFGVRVVLWRSRDPISETAAFRSVLTGENQPWGEQLYQTPDHYFAVTASDEAFNPGATAEFTVRGTLADLGFTTAGTIYLFGVQVLGTADASSNYQVLARTLTFYVTPPEQRLPLTSLVLLSSTPTQVRPGVFANERLVGELSGRLATMVGLADRPGVSWLVDPALVDEVVDMADGYSVVDGKSTRPGTGQQAAQAWLERFRALPDDNGARTLFGNPDVLGAERNNVPEVLQYALAAVAAVPEVLDLPLLVLPHTGVAGPATPAWLSTAEADAILVSTAARGPVIANGPAGSTLLRLAPPATSAGPGSEDGPVQRHQRQYAEAVLGHGLVRVIGTPEEAAADSAASPRWLDRTSIDDLLQTDPTGAPAALTLPAEVTTLPASRFRQLTTMAADFDRYRDLVPESVLAEDEPATLARMASTWWIGDPTAASWITAVGATISQSAVNARCQPGRQSAGTDVVAYQRVPGQCGQPADRTDPRARGVHVRQPATDDHPGLGADHRRAGPEPDCERAPAGHVQRPGERDRQPGDRIGQPGRTQPPNRCRGHGPVDDRVDHCGRIGRRTDCCDRAAHPAGAAQATRGGAVSDEGRETPATGGRRLLNATAVMASGTMVSRILGFGRAVLLAFALGNSTRQVEMFGLATLIPNTLYMLFAGGALNTVLVPQIVRAIKNDSDGGQAYINRVMTAFLAVLAVITLVMVAVVPWLLTLWTDPRWQALPHWQSLVFITYLTMPQLFFYGAFFLFGQVLNAKDMFGPMMWAPIANNIVQIGVLSLYVVLYGQGVDTSTPFTAEQALLLGVGSTLGIIAQTLVLVPFYRRTGFHYRPRWDLKSTGLGHTFHLAKWMMGYVALTLLAQVVVTRLATSAVVGGSGAGSNVYNQAYLIWVLPHSLVTVSLATAMLPQASRLAATRDLVGVADEVTRATRLAITFMVPAAVGLFVLAEPIARVAFGLGQGATDFHFVAWTMMAFAIGLVPYTIQYLYLRGFYALEDTRTPFLLQVVISGLNTALAIGFMLAGQNVNTVAPRLALAYSLSYLVGGVDLTPGVAQAAGPPERPGPGRPTGPAEPRDRSGCPAGLGHHLVLRPVRLVADGAGRAWAGRCRGAADLLLRRQADGSRRGHPGAAGAAPPARTGVGDHRAGRRGGRGGRHSPRRRPA